MERHDTQPSNNNEALEGIVVAELPPQLRDSTSSPQPSPIRPNIPPVTPRAIPRVELPQPPRQGGIPSRNINNHVTTRVLEPIVRRPAALVPVAAPPRPPISRETTHAYRSSGDQSGKGILFGGLALLLAVGVGATYKLTDQDNNVATLKAAGSRTPGTGSELLPPIDKTDQPAETMPEPADLSFLSVENINVEPSSPTTPVPKNTLGAKQPTPLVVPKVFPTTIETTQPPASPKPTPKPSSSPTKNTPSPTKTKEQTPTSEVKIPASPSMDSIKLINASINDRNVRELDDRYENFASNLDLEELARNGELSGLDINAIRSNQKLINNVYAITGVKEQIGQPKTLDEDSLRAMQDDNRSPATQLNAHTDTLLRNANSLYPRTGNNIVKAAVINDILVSRLTKTLENGDSLSVPSAENASTIKVRTARLSSDMTVAFVASYAEYHYDGERVGELRWTLLQPVNQAGDFVATTVWSELLKEAENHPQTPPPAEETPAPTYSETTEPTPNTDQTDTNDDRDDRDDRRRDRDR